MNLKEKIEKQLLEITMLDPETRAKLFISKLYADKHSLWYLGINETTNTTWKFTIKIEEI